MKRTKIFLFQVSALILLIIALAGCDQLNAESEEQRTVFYKEFRQGQLPNSEFEEFIDTYVYQDSSAAQSIHNFDDELYIGKDEDGDHYHTLIEIDLEGYFPADITVEKAVLTFHIYSKRGSESINITAHEVNSIWHQSYVSWEERNPGVTWRDPGGDFDSEAVGSGILENSVDSFDILLSPALIESWIKTPRSNDGIFLVPDNELDDDNYVRFYSIDEDYWTNRSPLLTIYYSYGM